MQTFVKILLKEVEAVALKETSRQFLSAKELKEEGYSHYRINQMVSSGKLASVNKKYYENLAYEGEPNDFYAAYACSEKGIICLRSAAVYYGLSSERPAAVDVALPRRTRIPESPEWPVMKFYLFSEERYETGITTVNEEGNIFHIYDREKTVCDIVFYRNKLGFEPAVEIVRNYLNSQDRDINRLMEYAKRLRVETAMRQFVEVMV